MTTSSTILFAINEVNLVIGERSAQNDTNISKRKRNEDNLTILVAVS
jgi:hypothetical protein